MQSLIPGQILYFIKATGGGLMEDTGIEQPTITERGCMLVPKVFPTQSSHISMDETGNTTVRRLPSDTLRAIPVVYRCL